MGKSICKVTSYLSMTSQQKKILTEFSAPSYEEWLGLAEDQFKKSFLHKTKDKSVAGISIWPLYTRVQVESEVQHPYPLYKTSSPSENSVTSCLDPLCSFILTKKYSQDFLQLYDEMASAFKQSSSFPALGIKTCSYVKCGADAVQELAVALATAVEYLREMHVRGVNAESLLPRICFTMSCGSYFFGEIAKFRALRLLWVQVLNALGAEKFLHDIVLRVEIESKELVLEEAYLDVVRATYQSFAALVGNCDILSITSSCSGAPGADDILERVVRNIQPILKEESALGAVYDPAGGAWFVEYLTNQMAKKAWEFFQQIEAKGGISSALKSNFLHEQIHCFPQSNSL